MRLLQKHPLSVKIIVSFKSKFVTSISIQASITCLLLFLIFQMIPSLNYSFTTSLS